VVNIFFFFKAFGIDLFLIIGRLLPMSGCGYWTNMITGVEQDVSLEDLIIPMTQDA